MSQFLLSSSPMMISEMCQLPFVYIFIYLFICWLDCSDVKAAQLPLSPLCDHRTSHLPGTQNKSGGLTVRSSAQEFQTESGRVACGPVGSQLDRSRAATLIRTATPPRVQQEPIWESMLGETHQQGGAALWRLNSTVIQERKPGWIFFFFFIYRREEGVFHGTTAEKCKKQTAGAVEWMKMIGMFQFMGLCHTSMDGGHRADSMQTGGS